MTLAVAVGFWDTGPEAIGEDMYLLVSTRHMYLKCFFATAGNVIVKTIYSPASQCNVEGDGTGISGYFSSIVARYTQSTRHLWGTLDFGYILRKIIMSRIAPESECTVDVHCYNSKDDHFKESTGVKHEWVLLHRIAEAHVLMGQFVLFVFSIPFIIPSSGSKSISSFVWSFLSLESPDEIVMKTLKIASYMRLFCLTPNLISFYYYEQYHEWASHGRWQTQHLQKNQAQYILTSTTPQIDSQLIGSPKRHIQPLGRRPTLASRRTYWHLFDWMLAPYPGIVNGLIPQFKSQLMHLFTNRLDYKVANKPLIVFDPGAPTYTNGVPLFDIEKMEEGRNEDVDGYAGSDSSSNTIFEV